MTLKGLGAVVEFDDMAQPRCTRTGEIKGGQPTAFNPCGAAQDIECLAVDHHLAQRTRPTLTTFYLTTLGVALTSESRPSSPSDACGRIPHGGV